MGKRDLVFIGLVVAGVFALGASLMPPREPRPTTHHDATVYNSPEFCASVAAVDEAFRGSWKGLQPAPHAPELAVARRLALGLIGAVPSLEEIRQFEFLPAAERLPWYLDHLLQDARFDDYFAERFARAAVGTENGPFIFFRRRRFVTWLAERLHRNVPYNDLVRDLIAAQGLWTNEPATNFLTVTVRQESRNQPDPVRLAGRTTRAFLGLRLDCAECHNHPFASWKQSDFRGLAAFFAQTHLGFTGIYDGSGEYEIDDRRSGEKKRFPPRVPFASDLLPSSGSRRERLGAWVTDRRNPYFAKAGVNRVWALMTGRPLVAPVDNLEGANTHPALEVLADDFASHSFDLRRLIRVIGASEAFRLDSAADHELSEAHDAVWAAFPLTRLRPEQVAGGVIQSSSVATIDSQSHLFVRLARFGQQNDFLQRYGDTGEDEFEGRGGTIPQRLLLMNGKLTREHIKEDLLTATGRIASMRLDDPGAVEAAYLTVLTRRPTEAELQHFVARLGEPKGESRGKRFEDLFWALVNSTEFSWNH